MAFTSVTEIATAEMAGTAATTLVLTVPAGGVATGEAVVVCGGGFKVISSVADSKGNTYAVAQTAGDGSTKCGSVAYCASVSTALVNGDTITVTWSASATNGCASAFKVAYTGTFALDVSTSGADAIGASAVTTGTTAGLADSAELYFMALGRDGASTVTLTHTTSGLTTGTQVNTSAGTARTLHTAYKILSADSAGQTYAGTLSAIRAWGCALAMFKAVAAGQSISLAGTITPAGALARLAAKGLAGTITPAGSLTRLLAGGTFGIAAGSDDGYATRTGAAYPPVDTSSVSTTATTLFAQKKLDAGTYYNRVILLRWDTSVLDDGSTVSSATLRVRVVSITGDVDGRNLVGEWYDFGAAIGTEDYAENVGTTAFSVDLTSLTAGAYNDITLTGLENVSLTGLTGLRIGVSGGEPTGDNGLSLASYEDTSFIEPQLIVVVGQAISLAGLITPAGALVRLTAKAAAGTITPAGLLSKLTAKLLGGTVTPSGALATTASVGGGGGFGTAYFGQPYFGQGYPGSPAAGGGQTISLAGTVTPAGVLVRLPSKSLAGSLAPAGALVRVASKALVGTIIPAGLLSKLTGKGLAGTVTPAGGLSRLTGKGLGGTITPAGLLTLLTGVKTIAVGGIITPVGTLTRKASKSLAGTLSMVGTLAFRAAGYNFGAFHDKKSRSMNVREIRGTSHKGHR